MFSLYLTAIPYSRSLQGEFPSVAAAIEHVSTEAAAHGFAVLAVDIENDAAGEPVCADLATGKGSVINIYAVEAN